MKDLSTQASAKAGSPMQVRTRIFKQKWLAAGMTEEEYERSQLLNELFHLAEAQGRPHSDLLTEFQTSSAEEIIGRYRHLLPIEALSRLTLDQSKS